MTKSFRLLTDRRDTMKEADYLEWQHVFKREFTEYLTALGIPKFNIGFGAWHTTGFIVHPDETVFYFITSDIRRRRKTIEIRRKRPLMAYPSQHLAFPFNDATVFTSTMQDLLGVTPQADIITDLQQALDFH